MKMLKTLAFAALSLAATGVLADAANTLVLFSSTGPDKYADGVIVPDGGVYALCWSPDNSFDGFTTTGDAINPDEKVIYRAALAEGGRCPLTLFEIDSAKAPVGGFYFVYLLDTRAGNGIVTGFSEAASYTGAAAGAMTKQATKATDNTVDGEGNPQSIVSNADRLADPAGIATPVITGIRVEGARVKISVGNILPGLLYDVVGGLDSKATLKDVKMSAQGAGKAEFDVAKEDARFFRVKAH